MNIIFKPFEGEDNWPHLVEMPIKARLMKWSALDEALYQGEIDIAKTNAVPFRSEDRKKVIIKMIDEEIIESDCIEDIDPEKIYSIEWKYKIALNHTEHCKIECWCDNEDRVATLLKEETIKEPNKDYIPCACNFCNDSGRINNKPCPHCNPKEAEKGESQSELWSEVKNSLSTSGLYWLANVMRDFHITRIK